MSALNQFFKIAFTHINRVNHHAVIGFGTESQAELYAAEIKRGGNIWDYLITRADGVPSGLNYGLEFVDLLQYGEAETALEIQNEYIVCGHLCDQEIDCFLVYAPDDETAERLFTDHLLSYNDTIEDPEVYIDHCKLISNMRGYGIGKPENATPQGYAMAELSQHHFYLTSAILKALPAGKSVGDCFGMGEDDLVLALHGHAKAFYNEGERLFYAGKEVSPSTVFDLADELAERFWSAANLLEKLPSIETFTGDVSRVYDNHFGQYVAPAMNETIKQDVIIDSDPVELVSYHVVFINTGNYETVEAAEVDGATYYTDSLDALTNLSDGSQSGFFELLDIVSTISKCLGMDDLVGFVNTNRGYITLNEYVNHIGK